MKIKSAVFPPISNNCYLIIDEKTNSSALVDCSVWNEDMEALIGDTDLKYVLLTHGHYDHIEGVSEVKKRYNPKVVISKEDEIMLGNEVYCLAAITRNRHYNCEADIIAADGDELKLGDITVKVIATPGHTKGGLCYLAGDSLFTGDTLFRGSCGRTDFPGGSVEKIIASLKKLSSLEGDYNVYPGHDGFSTLDYERKNNMYMNYGIWN